MRNHPRFVVALALAVSMVLPAIAQTPSPYAGEQGRAIKALSPEETSDYLAGKGMGLARAAELNGYPGPMHVLDLAGPLGLTVEQRARTQSLFDSMRAQAIVAGRALIDEERALDALFRERTIDLDALAAALARIGGRQAEVRRVHLAAHLAQVEILRADQVSRYNELRGYGERGSHSGHGRRAH